MCTTMSELKYICRCILSCTTILHLETCAEWFKRLSGDMDVPSKQYITSQFEIMTSKFKLK